MPKELPKPGDKLSINKLKDPEVVLHPQISKWRDDLVFDPLLYNSLEQGQIQPIVFRKLKDRFELLAGSRRYFHQKLRGVSWDDLYKDIRENVSDRDALLLAASENIFREDFTPWEEARAINDMLVVGKMSIKDVATHLGKSEAYVTSRRALLSLPEKTQKRFEKQGIPIGFATPVKKLSKFPKAQADMLEKIIEGRKSRYNGISKIEEAEEYVSKLLGRVKEVEALVNAYGPCPACGSKNITQAQYDEGNQLSCNDCNHRWHKDTKEPWKLYELKQEAEEMGFKVDAGPETLTLTPKDVANIQARQEQERREEMDAEAEKEAEKFAEKFRSPVYIEEIVIPLLPGNVQKMSVDGNTIEIELIEDSGLHFKGLKKDYTTGEKGRIEITYGYGDTTQKIAEKVHGIIAKLKKS